jgi:hypothetical protein
LPIAALKVVSTAATIPRARAESLYRYNTWALRRQCGIPLRISKVNALQLQNHLPSQIPSPRANTAPLSRGFQDQIEPFPAHKPMVFSQKHEPLLRKQDTVCVLSKIRIGFSSEKPAQK